MESDLDYYRRRLNEERDSAAQADRSEVRIVHEKLAKMYEARVLKLARGSSAAVRGQVQPPLVETRIGGGV